MAVRLPLKILGYAASMLVPVWAMAQTVEPEWRVINTEPAQAVPLVEGPVNPLPQVKEEVVPEVVVPVRTEEDIRKEAMRAQLEGLMQFVDGAPVVAPDMASVRVGGYMVGPKGGAVLMNGKWMKVGDSFKVGSRARPEASSTLQLLKSMRDGEADTMAARLEARMANPAPVTLKIIAISEKQVEVGDGKITYPLQVPRQRGF